MTIYRYRKLIGLKDNRIGFADITCPPEVGECAPLSTVLEQSTSERLFLCGTLQEMTREYVEEPLQHGWKFARQYVHKYRSPVFTKDGRTVSVKLVSESWFPGCHSMVEALGAWKALRDEWSDTARLPLLSTPSKSGQALLWESLPKGVEFPALPDDVARIIRANSPQHRLEVLRPDFEGEQMYYDGRWMYAALAGLDRMPVGEPIKAQGGLFVPYVPGWYQAMVRVPRGWRHIGLLPVPSENGEGWRYPSFPGEAFEGWFAEPELTLALSHGWQIEIIQGWKFAKGRPLGNWARKLIEMRARLSERNKFAAAAVREVLNHTIGSFHVDSYERENIVSQSQWRALIEEWGYERVQTLEKLDDGLRRVVHPVRHKDGLSVYMPCWSGQIWALERARVAQYALRCDRDALVEIRGDALYLSAEFQAPFSDNGNLGQLRKKEVKANG